MFDNEVAFAIMRSELGADPFSLYDFDSTTPIASASIGQVYKARLKDTNISVAVKVQRPEALSSASLDIFILRKLAFLVKKLRRLNTDLVSIVDQFGTQLFQELDYNSEARNCLRFRELYGGISGIYVPFAYTNMTRQRVLTMEFVEGVKGPWKVGGERMLTIGLQCSVMQLLESGYFHSDPHRGNLLQTPNGDLAYLDFGMMADVPMVQRYALVGTVLGLVNKDIPLVVSSLKDLDFLPPNSDVTEVVQVLERAIYSSTENGSGSSLNFTRLNQNLNEAAVSGSLPFRLPPFYSLIIRTLTILEGLALSVDKDFRLIRGAYPFIAKQVLTAQSPEMTRLLRSVLIDPAGRIRWSKLEQFLSIASNADSAINGNFAALKRAQSRSDFLKSFTDSQEDSNFNADTVIQILNFLDSENGLFIREPLVNEIVDGLDNLGLTVATLASILTNDIIPAPSEKPDREKVQQLVRLLQIFWEIAQSSLQKQLAASMPANATSVINLSKMPREFLFSTPGFLLFLQTLQQTVAWTTSSLQAQATELSTGGAVSNEKVVAIVRSLSRLLLAVLAQLAVRLTRRGVASIVTADNVKTTLPALTRLLRVSVRILNMLVPGNTDRD